MREAGSRPLRRAILPVAGMCITCGAADAPGADDPGAAPAAARVPAFEAPPRVHDDGSPDSCELLAAADPSRLLGADLAPALRIYGLCRVQAAPVRDPERSVGLEIRRDRAAVSADFDGFWEREGGGVEMLGSSRDRIEELDGLGDYALWFPIEGGLQLFAYWGGEYVLVATVRGVPSVRALPWARELAQASIRAAAAEPSRPQGQQRKADHEQDLGHEKPCLREAHAAAHATGPATAPRRSAPRHPSRRDPPSRGRCPAGRPDRAWWRCRRRRAAR
jgi:hypothetical protein